MVKREVTQLMANVLTNVSAWKVTKLFQIHIIYDNPAEIISKYCIIVANVVRLPLGQPIRLQLTKA